MEAVLLGFYFLLFAGLYVFISKKFQDRRLKKENERLTKESILENGRLEDREVMRVVRLRKQ